MRVQQNTLSAPRHQRFKQWVAEPANRQAFQSMVVTWIASDPRALRTQASIVDANDGSSTDRRSNPKARRLKPSTLLAAAIASLLALAPTNVRRELERQPATIVTHEQQEVTLDDGSIVDVDPGTKLTVDFSPTQRLVHLKSGQAIFNVARDPQRPFRVLTAMIQVEAIGTRFSVSLYEGQFTVAVSEGIVRLTPNVGNPTQALTRILAAGDIYTTPNGPLDRWPASATEFDSQPDG